MLIPERHILRLSVNVFEDVSHSFKVDFTGSICCDFDSLRDLLKVRALAWYRLLVSEAIAISMIVYLPRRVAVQSHA